MTRITLIQCLSCKTPLVPLSSRQRYCCSCRASGAADRAYARAYDKAHPEAHRARLRAYAVAHPVGVAARHRKHQLKKYGLTPPQYDALLNSQGGVCAICHLPPVRKRLSVDHDHTSGKVRGLLCFTCNAVTGHCEAGTPLLGVLSYISQHSEGVK
jgi:hypothetical protein